MAELDAEADQIDKDRASLIERSNRYAEEKGDLKKQLEEREVFSLTASQQCLYQSSKSNDTFRWS